VPAAYWAFQSRPALVRAELHSAAKLSKILRGHHANLAEGGARERGNVAFADSFTVRCLLLM
jgi:hypothetical protein